jgi:uncharacterized protein
MKLGVISDTHGHVHPHIHTLFSQVAAILHAGDMGNDETLIELQRIAPVTAVRGNMDRFGTTAASFNDYVVPTFAGVLFLIVHDLGSPKRISRSLQPIIERYQPRVIIFGHTHTPYLHTHGDVLYFNPGSATSGRSGRPESIGFLDILDGQVTGAIVPLS